MSDRFQCSLLRSQSHLHGRALSTAVASSSFRSHTCGELREDLHDGQRVVLSGWVDAIRPFGPISFLSLRDRHGSTQLVLEKDFLERAGTSGHIAMQ